MTVPLAFGRLRQAARPLSRRALSRAEQLARRDLCCCSSYCAARAERLHLRAKLQHDLRARFGSLRKGADL
jgi:hypothetical protein